MFPLFVSEQGPEISTLTYSSAKTGSDVYGGATYLLSFEGFQVLMAPNRILHHVD
jgi:hypothetical protein